MIGLNSPRPLDQTRRINELASHIRNSQIQLSKSNQLLCRFHDSLELYRLFPDRQARDTTASRLIPPSQAQPHNPSPFNALATSPANPASREFDPGPNNNMDYRCTQPTDAELPTLPHPQPAPKREGSPASRPCTIATRYQRTGSHRQRRDPDRVPSPRQKNG